MADQKTRDKHPRRDHCGRQLFAAPRANAREWILGGTYNWQVVQLALAVGQNNGGIINGQNFTSGGNAAAIDGSGGTWGGSSGGLAMGSR